MIGISSKGKKFTVVKIEKNGSRIPKTVRKDKVHISVKHLARSDVKIGEIFHF